MSELLVPPIASDPRSKVIDVLANRITELDRTPLLVYLLDIVPAQVLPLLAEQFNLTEIWPYLRNETAQREAIKNAVAWHRIKGTPAAITKALGWINVAAEPDDLSSPALCWAEYELALAAIPGPGQVPSIVALAQFAAPIRAHLGRMYFGWDQRRFVLDSSRLDDGLLDNDSGVLNDGILLSFLDHHRVALPELSTNTLQSLHAISHASTVPDGDQGWLLDAYTLDTPIMIDSAGLITAERVFYIFEDSADFDPITWGETKTTGHATPDLPLDALHRSEHFHAALSSPDTTTRTWRSPQRWSGSWRKWGGTYTAHTHPQ